MKMLDDLHAYKIIYLLKAPGKSEAYRLEYSDTLDAFREKVKDLRKGGYTLFKSFNVRQEQFVLVIKACTGFIAGELTEEDLGRKVEKLFRDKK